MCKEKTDYSHFTPSPHVTLRPYLHDDELQDQWQLADVTGRQVEQEGGVPDRVGARRALGLFGGDHFTVLSQVDDDVVVWGGDGRNSSLTHFVP